jgi:hypothetical protein
LRIQIYSIKKEDIFGKFENKLFLQCLQLQQ